MGKRYYAVKVGKEPGIYETWKECQEQTKGFPKAEFKGFDLLSDAENFMKGIRISKTPTPVKTAKTDLFENKSVPMIEVQNFSPAPNKAHSLPEEVTIYTDGSCFNAKEIQQGRRSDGGLMLAPGGYAAVFIDQSGKELLRISGGNQATTNNKMELTAVKEALQHLEDGKKHKVHLFSDSQYMVNSFTKGWVNNWKKNALKINDELIWRKSNGEIVKNQELLKSIDKLRQHHDVEFTYTRAHVGTKYNEICDQEAKKMSEQMNRIKSYEEHRKAQEKETHRDKAPGITVAKPSAHDMGNSR